MGSSEEYLDRLLQEILEGKSSSGTKPVEDSTQTAEPVSVARVADQDDHSVEEVPDENLRKKSSSMESNKAMSPDEIEEMFASMSGIVSGGSFATVEEAGSVGNGFEKENTLDDWGLEESVLSGTPQSTEETMLNDWDLEEKSIFPEESVEIGTRDAIPAENTVLDELEVIEESAAQDWALEEDWPEQEAEAGEAGLTEHWSLEEDILPEEAANKEDKEIHEEAEIIEKYERKEEAGIIEEYELKEESGIIEEYELKEESGIIEEYELKEESGIIEEIELREESGIIEESELREESGIIEESELREESGIIEESELREESGIIEEYKRKEEAGIIEEYDLREESGIAEESEPKEESENIKEIVPEDWALDEDTLMDAEKDTNLLPEDWSIEEDSLLTDESDLQDMGQEDENILADLTSGREDILSNLMDSMFSEFESDTSGIENDDMAAGATMTEEDVNRLLGDDFALTESEEEDDLSALLGSMGEDEDLSEINDLLTKADSGLMEEDDMLALLGGTSGEEEEMGDDAFDFWGNDESIEKERGTVKEIVPPEAKKESSSGKKEKKKKEKKSRKNKKGNMNSVDGGEDGARSQGFFKKLLNILTEEDEEEASDTGRMELGSISDENRELLAELEEEDKKNAGKKEKKKKEKKVKDKKKKGDDKSAKKKEKKAAKPKKPKKEKKVRENEPKVPEKKISKTKIIIVALFCSSVAMGILVVNMLLPDYLQIQEACEKYEEKQYEEAYDLLYGKDLSEQEAAVLQKSSIILQVKRKQDSYETYNRLNMPAEALNALLEGIERYHMFWMDAQQYGVTTEIDGIYAQILAELSGNYGLSEDDALNILASESDLSYSEKLYGIINGTGFASADEEAEVPVIRQDVLPEEEEIIDRLEGTENSDISDDSEESPEGSDDSE